MSSKKHKHFDMLMKCGQNVLEEANANLSIVRNEHL